MQHSRQTFVLQRRINHPLADVERALDFGLSSERANYVGPFHAYRLVLDRPVQLLASWPLHSWRTDGRLVTSRDRRVARIEIEFSVWSTGATELSLRPVANHPERWTGGRQCRYFDAAHRAADGVLVLVNERCEQRDSRTDRELIAANSSR
jgi:hypothetical protein